MAAAPKASKRSAAQVAAGKKFAAGGRAAQAAARAKGKKPSAAQHQAALKWAAAGRAAQAARKSGKKVPVKSVKRAAIAPELAVSPPGYWLGQPWDTPSCPAVAVANHLLAATGLAMSKPEILALYMRAGGSGGGALIGDVLEVLTAARAFRVAADNRNWVRLARFCPVDPDVLVAGYVVGLALPHAGHAVLAHPRGMVSWGRVLPWKGVPEEAWALEWTRE